MNKPHSRTTPNPESSRSSTESKWRAIHELYLQNPSETQRHFCSTRNISLASFQYWRAKFKKQESTLPAKIFHEIIPATPVQITDSCTVELANGRKLILQTPITSTTLQQLIGALES